MISTACLSTLIKIQSANEVLSSAWYRPFPFNWRVQLQPRHLSLPTSKTFYLQLACWNFPDHILWNACHVRILKFRRHASSSVKALHMSRHLGHPLRFLLYCVYHDAFFSFRLLRLDFSAYPFLPLLLYVVIFASLCPFFRYLPLLRLYPCAFVACVYFLISRHSANTAKILFRETFQHGGNFGENITPQEFPVRFSWDAQYRKREVKRQRLHELCVKTSRSVERQNCSGSVYWKIIIPCALSSYGFCFLHLHRNGEIKSLRN